MKNRGNPGFQRNQRTPSTANGSPLAERFRFTKGSSYVLRCLYPPSQPPTRLQKLVLVALWMSCACYVLANYCCGQTCFYGMWPQVSYFLLAIAMLGVQRPREY